MKVLLVIFVLAACVAGLTRGEKRIKYWQKWMAETQEKNLSPKKLIKEVNTFWNRNIRYVSDSAVNQFAEPSSKDYWQTPKETLLRNMGDCEDFAIAKYLTLRALHVDEKHLRMVYVHHVRRRVSTPHMVLGYWAEPNDQFEDIEVLDNIKGRVRLMSKRRDLHPVYSFNTQGLWLMRKQGNLRDYLHTFTQNRRNSKWFELLDRVKAGN